MTEWSKVHDWKSCVPKGTKGSNPLLSAKFFDDKLRKAEVPAGCRGCCAKEGGLRLER